MLKFLLYKRFSFKILNRVSNLSYTRDYLYLKKLLHLLVELDKFLNLDLLGAYIIVC